MKTIGLLGGMSWESTVEYYRILNQETGKRLGGLSSAKILLHSVNFAEAEPLIHAGDWDGLGRMLGEAGKGLAGAGAELIAICTNTMHRVADVVADVSGLPLVHIGEAAAEECARLGFRKVGLLGTKPTMELDFYRAKLADRGVKAIIPGEADRELVNRIIFEELCLGKFTDSSRAEYVRIIEELAGQGAEAAVLGCTEIPLLVKPEHSPVPLLDTTDLHAKAILEAALG